MRKIAAIFFFCLTLSATPAFTEPLRVALLLEHEQRSMWTDLLRKGLAITSLPDIQADVIVASPGPGQRQIFRDAAASHDVVLVASDNLHEALRDNAANFRRVMFGSIDAGIRAPNIMSVTFADEQAAFLAGAAAAMVAGGKEAPIIGWLSGADTPALRSLFNGYSEGALLAQPGCRIIQAVVGSFTDPVLAAKKAAWLLDSGASVIALAAGAGNPAALAEARKRGAKVIELDAFSGESVLGAIAKAADRAVAEILVSAASGKFRGKEIITYDLANGGVNFETLGSLSPNILRRLGELRREIDKGAIRLHSLRQRTLCDCLD